MVKRAGNRWDFAEEMCWKEEGHDELCSETSAAYEIEGDRLFTIVNEEKLPVDIIEIDSDYLLMSLYTSEFSFTAVLTLEGKILSQNGVVEMNDGTKEYQLLKLTKK